jgi:hypothetical protein
MLAVELLVDAFVGYLVIGFLFAVAFVTVGIGRMDHVAKDSGFGFRLIIVPGVVALWPLLLKRWVA